jgi:hypothetical protein
MFGRGNPLAAILAAGVLALPIAAAAQGNLMDAVRGAMGSAGQGAKPSTGASAGDIASGLREALRVGTERVVGTVGRQDGFNADPAIHIPLPGKLAQAQGLLRKAGMSSMADDLELRINRAAEAAAPEAKRIFWKAVESMTLEDAKSILNGPQDAATQYFKRTMSPDLKTAMRPVVDKGLADAGAVKSYDALLGKAKGIPLMPDLKANLTDHALDGALGGLFHYLAKEEAAIRSDPAKRTSDILRKVFGSG